MNTPLLVSVVDVLVRSHVRYGLVGAGAMAAHGVARSTVDIDLLTTDRRVLAAPFWQALAAQEGVTVDVRTADAGDPLAGFVRTAADGERRVDVVVGRSRWQDGIIGRARPTSVQSVTVPVVTIADLVVLKLYTGGSQDAWDIEQLLAAGDEDLIRRDVDLVVSELPFDAQALWHRLGGPPPGA